MDLYSVFDGFSPLENTDDNIFTLIEREILNNYQEIQTWFKFDHKTNQALNLIAKNNRKRYSINKKINHFKANSIINELLLSQILYLEKSKEKKIIRNKRQKLKKHLRHYVIQDKLLFKNHFTRFFFYFLKPNEKLILNNDFQSILELIKKDFEHYQSFCFECLSKECLEKTFQITNVSSFWNKDIELDLFYQDEKRCIVGEVKFKNKKICKNILNLLKHKAESLQLKIDYYVIFSKNGFSRELLKNQEQNLLLFDLKDFKILLQG
ncbi:DUF234 domain-containing protein [Campylobacter sp. US33a]|uniref:DUF234 domain-containing protein n=1 Tax=Campylobacter sp. CCS1377 TaxID=3158229 RepID=A0AAU7E860_9BACT|nr:DUF234 domain-containing protein [Campylobacter sp. US33a]